MERESNFEIKSMQETKKLQKEKAKKFIFIVWGIVIFTRVFMVVVETVFMINRELPIVTSLMDYAMLAIAGGFFTLSRMIENDMFSNFQIGDGLYRLLVISLTVSMLVQIVGMFMILGNKNCKNYFEESQKSLKISRQKLFASKK